MTGTTSSDGENKPTPDPTILTTQQLLREVSGVIALLKAEINGNQSTNDVRFEGFGREYGVRFTNIDVQFAAIESWRKEQKSDTQKAVDAALQAAKEAVGNQQLASSQAIAKTESAVADQLKQLILTFTAEIKGLRDAQDDIKDRVLRVEGISIQQQSAGVIPEDLRNRVTKGESAKVGAMESHQEARLDLGSLIGVIGVVTAIASVLITVIVMTR